MLLAADSATLSSHHQQADVDYQQGEATCDAGGVHPAVRD